MSESELYKDLGSLTKDKSRWKESIPYVSSLLTHESVTIQAKVLWLLGEMGLERKCSELFNTSLRVHHLRVVGFF